MNEKLLNEITNLSQMDKINGFADQGPWKESSQIRASQICCVAVICYRSNMNKQNK